MDNQQVTQTELAWLAGIWDGEGTIAVRRNAKINQMSPRVHFTNTNASIILKAVEIMEKIGVKPHVREKGQGGFEGSHKECYTIGFDTLSKSKLLLDTLLPYLVGKKDQAILLLKFINSRMGRWDVAKNNDDKSYTQDDLETIARIYDLNGNIRGTSETIRQLASVRG